MALVNSYEDTMDQEHFALRYESFRAILVDERKNRQLSLLHTFALAVFRKAFGQ